MKNKIMRSLGILIIAGSLLRCDFSLNPDSENTQESGSTIYSTIGEVYKVYKPKSRFFTGQEVTIKGQNYTFDGNLVEYATVSQELLNYVEALEKNNALMHQAYESVVFDPDHKYVEMALYLNNSTGTYDIIEIRVFYGNFLETYNMDFWYAKSMSFTSDFSREFFSGRPTNFTFANKNDSDNTGSSDVGNDQGETPENDPGNTGSSGNGNDQGETTEIENTFFIGTATEGVYAGTRFYIGNADTGRDTPPYVYSLPGWHLHLGSDWDNTPTWQPEIENMLSFYSIKKDNRMVRYSDLPDYSGTGTRNNRMQHFVFSLGLTNEQTQDYSNDPETQKDFFGIIPDGYTAGNYAGGILYHWTWDSIDKTNEIGEVLVQKGYHLTYTSPTNTASMSWHGTRVEMNTISSPRYYMVEYFDGKGNFWLKEYGK